MLLAAVCRTALGLGGEAQIAGLVCAWASAEWVAVLGFWKEGNRGRECSQNLPLGPSWGCTVDPHPLQSLQSMAEKHQSLPDCF